MTARGIRNNNPLNLEKGDEWQGMAEDQSSDPRFVVFQSPDYGFRAAAIILRNYQRNYGCHDIRSMIERWAPPTENNTGAYVSSVAKACNANPDAIFDLSASSDPNLRNLLRAMCVHENGECPYDDLTIDAGIGLARKR